jgi:hypothetical protein
LQEVNFHEYASTTTKNRGEDITWGTYNSRGSARSDWACVKVVATWSNSNYIRSIIIAIATSDNGVVVTRTKNNLSTKNYIVVNKGIRRATTNSIYNRKSDSASIWNISKTNYTIDKVDYYIDRSNFWTTWSKTIKHLAFLRHFLSRILRRNLEYMWGNVKGVVTCDNY